MVDLLMWLPEVFDLWWCDNKHENRFYDQTEDEESKTLYTEKHDCKNLAIMLYMKVAAHKE